MSVLLPPDWYQRVQDDRLKAIVAISVVAGSLPWSNETMDAFRLAMEALSELNERDEEFMKREAAQPEDA